MSPPNRPHAARSAPYRSYDWVAWAYDEVAAVYSLGRIRRANAQHLQHVKSGDRVLYAGVGRGAQVSAALDRGARVTALDLAPAMLRRLAKSLASRASDVELIEGDLFEHRVANRGPNSDAEGHYDLVVAPFVLNVFDRPTMRLALTHLAALVRPGGQICISDFAPPDGGIVAEWFCRAYYAPVAICARVVGLAALHPIYDYAPILDRLGFQQVERHGFPLLRSPGRAPPVYESLLARKPDA